MRACDQSFGSLINDDIARLNGMALLATGGYALTCFVAPVLAQILRIEVAIAGVPSTRKFLPGGELAGSRVAILGIFERGERAVIASPLLVIDRWHARLSSFPRDRKRIVRVSSGQSQCEAVAFGLSTKNFGCARRCYQLAADGGHESFGAETLDRWFPPK